MRYLLDTHTILWVLEDEQQLSQKAKKVIADLENDCCISVTSLFEMAIKRKIGKLFLSKNIEDYALEIKRIGIKILDVQPQHLEAYEQIPLYNDHRDPFDRLLIATAFAENLHVITDDSKFGWYEDFVKVTW